MYKKLLNIIVVMTGIFSIVFLGSVQGFLEDYYLPTYSPNVPYPTSTTPPYTTPKPRPSPPPPPPPSSTPRPDNNCDYLCHQVDSCRRLIQLVNHQELLCANQTDVWQCFEERYDECLATRDCLGPAEIRGGFGFTREHRDRCMPLFMCRYLAQIHVHVNQMHPHITWS